MMKSPSRASAGRSCAAIGCLLLTTAAYANPPTLDALFDGTRLQHVSISPDGRYLALIVRAGGESFIAVKDRRSSEPSLTVLAANPQDQMEPRWCHWVNPTRTLCSFYGRAKGRHFQRYYPVTRLAAVDADGGKRKVLLHNRFGDNVQYHDQIIDWRSEQPNSVLIEYLDVEPDFGSGTWWGGMGVYALDVYSGKLKLVVGPQEKIGSFGTDGNGNVRLGWGVVDTKAYYFARLKGDQTWRQLARVDVLSSDQAFMPIAPIRDTNFVYAMRDHEGRSALWKIDLEDKHDPELVFARPDVDVAPLFSSDRRLLATTFEADGPGAFYTDPDAELLFTVLGRLFAGRRYHLVDMTADLKIVVVGVQSDTAAPVFHVLDMSKRPASLETVGSRYPALARSELATTRPISYAARDGTRIPGYLTLPVGKQNGLPPLIAMPHGGPMARDTWGFDPWVQFLASRGYAVLQMNFRGSAGYGSEWRGASHKDWAGLPYSDMIDGVRWALEQKHGDSARVCVVGGSFGGYLALTAATRDSQMFRCVVSIAGVSDLSELIHDSRFFGGWKVVREIVGTDSDKLRQDSPRRHADAVNVPVLLIHGEEDFTVDADQTKMMDAALTKAGKKHEVVIVKDADHYFLADEQFKALLSAMGTFLDQHLAGPTGGHSAQ